MSILFPPLSINTYVSVNPNAKSSISFSSSEGSSILSKYSGSQITWQVEHASDPSQAPIIISFYQYPVTPFNLYLHTFKINIVSLCKIQHGISFSCFYIDFLPFRCNEMNCVRSMYVCIYIYKLDQYPNP